MTIEAIQKADAVLMATDPSGFFEEVTLHPLGVAGNARTIRALVVREDTQPTNESANHNAKLVRLRIPNDATYGVTSVALGKDKVLVRARVGEAPTTIVIRRVVSQVWGFWFLEGSA